MKHITTINFEIPGFDENNKPFSSKASLDDGDIIVFNPFDYYQGTEAEGYQGKHSYNDASSFQIKDCSEYWQREIFSYLESGKNIFIILEKHYTFFIKTGEHTYSGTGRNARRTNFVTEYNNYNFIKIPGLKLINTQGEKIKAVDNAFLNFLKEFEGYINYQNYISHPNLKPVLKTKNQREIVGGILQVEKGNIIFLPNIDFEDGILTEVKNKKPVWTNEALILGEKFIHFILEIDRYIQQETIKSLKPEWLSNERYSLKVEQTINQKIQSNEAKITSLNAENIKLNQKLDEETLIKGLLYETGKPLESAVNKALQILGYKAENYNDGKLEMDAVIISPEGDRFIGECEGKDNKDIDISKFRQLSDALAEDFARDEILEKAFGLLFGNPQRLIDVDTRKLDFTVKCKSGATREGIGLIRTSDLFLATKYLLEHSDEDYKLKCRQFIKQQLGSVVIFPEIPA